MSTFILFDIPHEPVFLRKTISQEVMEHNHFIRKITSKFREAFRASK